MIKKIQFSEIEKIWSEKLWPNRKSKIEPTSGMHYLSEWSKEIMSNKPTFFGYFIKDKLVGVNSGHKANDNSYRSRGLWVNPKYRGNGIAKKLLQATIDQAAKENCDFIWSIPRKSSLKTYLSVGFRVTSDEIVDLEFGPNFYTLLKI